jgi:hypothetical protein
VVPAVGRTAVIDAGPRVNYTRADDGGIENLSTETVVSVSGPAGLGVGDYLDVDVRTRGNRAIIVILGPVGQYPSRLALGDQCSVEGINGPQYYWAKAGNLRDWFGDMAASGAKSAVETAIKAAAPECVRIALIGFSVLAGSTRRGGLEQVGISEAAMALVEATGVGYKAKLAAAFLVGGVIGAASSKKGEVGIVAFAINDLGPRTPEELLASGGEFDSVTRFRINSPAYHPYGDYTVMVVGLGDDMPDASSLSPWEVFKQARGLSAATAVPAVTETGVKAFSMR